MTDNWRTMDTAPKDGNAFLAYGRHTHSPDDAQRGVMPGDHWWGIILWDIWRPKSAIDSRWVFAKDGARAWSEPLAWQPLTAPESLVAAPDPAPGHNPTPVGYIKAGETYQGMEIISQPGLEPDTIVFVTDAGPTKRPPPTCQLHTERPPATGGEARSSGITGVAHDDTDERTRDS